MSTATHDDWEPPALRQLERRPELPALDRWINAHIDLMQSAMDRWRCSPLQAIAALTALDARNQQVPGGEQS